MLIDKMVSSISLNLDTMTERQLYKLEVKLASIEERIRMQVENAIMDYVSEQMCIEDSKKKLKPYYRKGRWD